MKLRLILISVFFLSVTQEVSAQELQPYLSLIHYHTDWDDGEDKVEAACKRAIGLGCRVLAITPHNGLIYTPNKPIGLKTVYLPNNVGYDRFLAEVERCQSIYPNLTVIPGAEYGQNSHFLAIGIYTKDIFDKGHNLLSAEGQVKAIEFLRSQGVVVIAAHPDLKRVAPQRNGRNPFKTDLFQYLFDWKNAPITYFPNCSLGFAELDGIELLNNGNQPDDTLLTNLSHIWKYTFCHNVTLTGGSDYHTDQARQWAEENDRIYGQRSPFGNELKRFTVVWSFSPKPNDIIQALSWGWSGAYFGKGQGFNLSRLPTGFISGQGANEEQIEFNLPQNTKGWYRWHIGSLSEDRCRYSVLTSDKTEVYHPALHQSFVSTSFRDKTDALAILELENQTADYFLIGSWHYH